MSPTNPVFFERLTPENAALLLIDMQTGLMLGVTTISPVELKNNVLALAHLSLTYQLPTLLTTSAVQGPNGPYLPEVAELFPGQEIQNRMLVNAWDDPKFVAAVEKTGRKKLIMAAITTDVCLLFPALAAVQAGYDVYAVVDASGCFSTAAESSAITRMAQAGVKITGWGTVTAELLHDWSQPISQKTGAVLGQYMPATGYLVNNMAAQQATANQQAALQPA
ncbi:isochorismatase family protein [Hymenobacter bucti]|uniref:Isochorismatase family protein n=1 Tax=Hymenobacter bucti TaxID=1844114 RepID=A0ABW4R0T4_9BACT